MAQSVCLDTQSPDGRNSCFCYSFVMPRPRKEDDSDNPWVVVARYSEIGFIIPAAVLLGFILGKVLDHYLHTTWIYIVGLLVGAAAGFIEMIRMAVRSNSDES